VAPFTPSDIGTGSANDNGTATALTDTGTVAIGNTIFVLVAADPNASNITVDDNASGGSNTYTKDADVSNTSGISGGVRTLVFSARVIHALNGTASQGKVSVHFPPSTPAAKAVRFFSFNDLVSPPTADKSKI